MISLFVQKSILCAYRRQVMEFDIQLRDVRETFKTARVLNPIFNNVIPHTGSGHLFHSPTQLLQDTPRSCKSNIFRVLVDKFDCYTSSYYYYYC
jgi:hypothetical protein